tara:strand:- start:367 stop:600 length:234 start_codon:yes stop_codon:yes gene_type:complete
MKYKIKAEHFLGATSELADEIMQKKYSQEEYEKLIQYEDKEKTCSYFTEKGQDIFNEILSDVENILDRYGIIHEGAE